MPETGSGRRYGRSIGIDVREFLATPFMLIAHVGLYMSSFILRRPFILLEVQEDDEESD